MKNRDVPALVAELEAIARCPREIQSVRKRGALKLWKIRFW